MPKIKDLISKFSKFSLKRLKIAMDNKELYAKNYFG